MLPTREPIETRYPQPSRFGDLSKRRPDTYCVGGAILLYLEDRDPESATLDERFPGPRELQRAIQDALGSPLTVDQRETVLAIIETNDSCSPAEAWAYYDDLIAEIAEANEPAH